MTLSHGSVSGNPVGKLSLANGERLSSMFGTFSDRLNSLGFITDQGPKYGPWGNNTKGSLFLFSGSLKSFFGAVREETLVALGAWANDDSVPQPPPPPPPSLPTLDANGFDVDEPCPETQLVGSGINYHLMENQVWQTEPSLESFQLIVSKATLLRV